MNNVRNRRGAPEKHLKVNKCGLCKVSVIIFLVFYYICLGINLETPVSLVKN